MTRGLGGVALGAAPRVACLIAFGLGLTAAPRAAHANGAFPDAQSILTPAARPQEISLVTNFGLVVSQDAGRTWLWSCEQAANSLGYLYQYGPAPRTRLFAIANQSLIFSDNGTCGWQVAAGKVTDLGVTDFFPDPSNADRVLAVAFDYTTTAYSVLQSNDGGVTFTTALYTGAAKESIDGVEIARSDPKTIYLTNRTAVANVPQLGHSSDAGATWQFTDLSPTLGAGTASIIAVDPTNPQTILLLFKGAVQSLALSRDGGRTVTVSLAAAMGAYFTSSTRTSTGAILVGGVDASTTPNLFRSLDGGVTFQKVANQPPSIRGLSVRGAQVFAAADNFGDGYALGVSSDDGMTWQPMMSYGQVAAIVACQKASCQMICDAEVTLDLWDAKVCSADPPPPAADGGATSDAGTHDGGSGGATAGGQAGQGGQTHPASTGGGCAIAPGAASLSWLGALVGLAALARRRRRPYQRARRSPR